jgi:KUP system potassium uptake protein
MPAVFFFALLANCSQRSAHMSNGKESPLRAAIKSLGLVFGDIGTSPIYTLTVVFLLLPRTPANITGVLSLIVWTLVILVTVEYAFLAMSLSKKGEGGTIVLREILVPLLKGGRKARFVTFLSFVGISLLTGDGVITPAISILSAVEGILLIPGCEKVPQTALIAIAAGIAIALFAVQKKGTGRISGVFGPVMLLWFLTLAVSGIAAIIRVPGVLTALSPWPGLSFLLHHGLTGFFVLSEVILCATGGEALYADMGHLGRDAILRGWYFVFGALLLNYLGQGAFLAQNPEAENVLFAMILHQARFLYVPFLLLSIAATIIASQAMISGMFSIVYQGMVTRIMPLFKVEYTSTDLRTQIYIGATNWFLLASVLTVMIIFKKSSGLAAAYGLAVTGTMTLTGVMMTWIFIRRRQRTKTALALLVTVADLAFLLANLSKLPHGGYWSLVIAAVPLALILIYTAGQKRLFQAMKPMHLEMFLEIYWQHYKGMQPIPGSALFFARDMRQVPPYLATTMFANHIIYEDNIIVSITQTEEPFGASAHFRECYAGGMRHFEITLGYMEVVDMGRLLREAGIRYRAIFYGLEEITTTNPIWQVFSLIKRVTPSYVHFYKLPPDRMHGVITRVEM